MRLQFLSGRILSGFPTRLKGGVAFLLETGLKLA
jgi:hypothetical protein